MCLLYVFPTPTSEIYMPGSTLFQDIILDPFDQPVLDHKNRKVTPPDLRKERQLALCEELLKPKYAVNGFKTAELQRTLSGLFENSAQIRYEMKKLMARGAIKKQKGKSFYIVTESGLERNGFGHQLPPSAISEILLFQPLLKLSRQELRRNPIFLKKDWGSSIRV